jgi:acyl-CoA reductase-like NAD-dependent aldehyde dehydrogenase
MQVQSHVEDAVAKGGRVTIGGKRPDLPEPYNKVCVVSVRLQLHGIPSG